MARNKADPPHQAHDRLFKLVCSTPDAALAVVRHALGPEGSLVDEIDPGSFRPAPPNEVDEFLGEDWRDFVFSCRLRGRETLIFFLVEHQRRVDPNMPFMRGPEGPGLLRRVVRYTLSKVERLDAGQLRDTISEAVGPEGGEVVMSTAQELIDQGLREGAIRLLRSLLKEKFKLTSLPEEVELRLSEASERQLDTWGKRVLGAKKLADVFAQGTPRQKPGLGAEEALDQAAQPSRSHAALRRAWQPPGQPARSPASTSVDEWRRSRPTSPGHVNGDER